jgi:hypothetical protein
MWIERSSPIGVETPRRGVSTKNSAACDTQEAEGLLDDLLKGEAK